MQKLIYLFTYWFLLTTFFVSCGTSNTQAVEEEDLNSLREAFAADFTIGTAISAPQIMGEDAKAAALIATEFNSLTPENVMKWMHIHPRPEEYDFELPDKLLELAQAQDKELIAHTLVWHSQLAPWVNEISDSTELAELLAKHINTIVGRYKGKVAGWDVVNEALNEDGTLRETIFLNLLGKDYLPTAFKLAAAVDPDTELYYNDYNLCQPEKRAGCVQLVKDIQAAGAKIDGVGIQAHWNLSGPPLEEIEASILAYHALGVKVMFTELDIGVLPNPWDLDGANVNQDFENSEFMNPYPQILPDAVQTQLADRYEGVFKLFLKHSDKISRVTFWGVHDGHSWLNNWPINGRTNYPLLFDENYQKKEAYHRVMALKESIEH
ncbi:MAG: endo-1,4-beta-xylanase [Lewinella sp.]|uniref:endo-1,4-beta-xylanase n=1 Tax=Lewinella sp. TaxID=2004506 RepID=UPI003D6C588F